MKKQIFLRSLLGAFVGCFIGVVIIVCISLAIGGGDMHVATPALLAQVGSEVGAFSLQMAAAMLIGAIWSGASVIWEVERWSLLRQTLTHFLLCSVVCLPIAWAMGWKISPAGISSASSRCTPVFGCLTTCKSGGACGKSTSG